MRRLALAGFSGWAIIMALGWFLADSRAGRCSDTYNCAVNELGTRDAFLIFGLLVPFVIAIGVAVLAKRRREAFSPHPSEVSAFPVATKTLDQRILHQPRFNWMKLLRLLGSQTATLIGIAFSVGWISAYLIWGWHPAQGIPVQESTELSEEAAAALDASFAAEAAAEGSDIADLPNDPND